MMAKVQCTNTECVYNFDHWCARHALYLEDTGDDQYGAVCRDAKYKDATDETAD